MGQRIVRPGRRREPWLAGARHRVWLRRNWPGVRWLALAWSFLWTRGTFARRFWTVVLAGLAVYIAADLIAAWAVSR
jgi:hypothetical protein